MLPRDGARQAGRALPARRRATSRSASSSRASRACAASRRRCSRCRARRTSRARARSSSIASRRASASELPIDPVSLEMAQYYLVPRRIARRARSRLDAPRSDRDARRHDAAISRDRGVVWPGRARRRARHRPLDENMKPLLVVNPKSGGGRTGAIIGDDPRRDRAQQLGEVEVVQTSGRGTRSISREAGATRRPRRSSSPSEATARSTRSCNGVMIAASKRRARRAHRPRHRRRLPKDARHRASPRPLHRRDRVRKRAPARRRQGSLSRRRKRSRALLREHLVRGHGRPRRRVRRERLARARRDRRVFRRVDQGAPSRAAAATSRARSTARRE